MPSPDRSAPFPGPNGGPFLVAPLPGSWACKTCRYHNVDAVSVCTHCGTACAPVPFGPEQRALLECAKRENWKTGRLLTELREMRRKAAEAAATSREGAQS